MAQKYEFPLEQAKIIAKLINNLCIAGSQIMQMDQPNIWHKACANLRELQRSNQELLGTLDNIGRSLNEEIVSSVIENLDRRANDAAGTLSMTRRCLNASALLAHCVAMGNITWPTQQADGSVRGSPVVH